MRICIIKDVKNNTQLICIILVIFQVVETTVPFISTSEAVSQGMMYIIYTVYEMYTAKNTFPKTSYFLLFFFWRFQN